ncbi:PaaI family thioesterase [Hoeflea olei]|uniref:Phenylacetic acid degradation protein n=1 Tax=Hoeflea olei TaxID=1480615 RepID=A0A1C1YW49_9HYPH|nr:PaaI family thioesterase [Hoeflea olei]OCW57707.1 phenylacetic acid degradation protein [Hoeflea olei]
MSGGADASKGQRFTGVIPLDVVAREGGLSVMRGMLEGRLPGATMARTLNFRLTRVEEGLVAFSGAPTADHLNPLGSVHGGWAATILDSALACAVMTTLPPGEGYTTVEFKLNLTRPMAPDMEEVSCEGRVVHRGRTLATSEAFLRDASGKLLAHGTETCAIFPIEKLSR